MGVLGLLPFAKAAISPSSISELAESGVRVAAADAYCWLHRAAAASATPGSAAGDGRHVAYCMKYVRMLLSYNIKPILVFDGRHLPAKAATEEKRRESRKLAKRRAAELMAVGNFNEAKTQYRRSIDITHEMALEVIKECREINVDCIVAPYEADAQLAYLNRINIAQVVITEDSDLILFGCNKILFKMDLNGNGMLMDSAKLPLVMKCPLEKYRFEKFRQMCILSGCDYLASLPGIGLAKARQFINSTRDPDISNALRKIPSFFSKSRIQVTDEYRDNFLKAEATFKHQLVYDPLKRKMLALIDVDDEDTDLKYCSNAGEYLDSNIAFQLAIGNLDPFSLKQMDDWNPDDPNFKPKGGKTNGWNQCRIAPHASIWHKDYFEKANRPPKIKEKIQNAILMPNTRTLQSKIVNTVPRIENKPLTIEDLSKMYSEKTPTKRKRVDLTFEDSEEESNSTSHNESSIGPTKNTSFSEMLSSITFSDQGEEKTSPILVGNKRTYKRLMEGCSANKLKRLSKFQRTTLDENDVQSKFFGIYTPEYSNENLKENCSESQSIKEEDVSVEDIDESSIDISISNRRLTSENSDWLKECESPKRPMKTEVKVTTPKYPFRKQDSESPIAEKIITSPKNPFKKQETAHFDMIKKEINFTEILTPSNSQISTKAEFDDSDSNSIKINKELSNNFAYKSSNSMKNTVKCTLSRRQGLSKKKQTPILPSGQQMLSNFGFQKKSQLKH